ncbi:MAG: tetratricopeptide repeat protein [Rhodospirillaceae bacterium]
MAPDSIDTRLTQARAFHQKGALREAANLYRDILKEQGEDGEVLNLLGAVLLEAGLHDQAQDILQRALVVGGANSSVLHNYGLALHKGGRWPEAVRALRYAGNADPANAAIWFVLANLLVVMSRFPEAEEAFEACLRADGDHMDCLINYGAFCRNQGRLADAEEYFRRAQLLAPGDVRTMEYLGRIQVDKGRFEDAALTFLEVLRRSPDYLEARLRCASTLQRLGRHEEGLDLLDGADETGTGVSISRAHLYRDLGRFDEAAACLDAAAPEEDDAAAVLANQALLRQHQGDAAGAAELYRQAIETAPENRDLNVNLAHALLLDGEYADGWREFDRRVEEPAARAQRPNWPGKKWEGEPLAGKSILVAGEQGHGDYFQFLRYLSRLMEQGAAVTASASARLHPVLSSRIDGVNWVPIEGPYPETDYFLRLMSLPAYIDDGRPFWPGAYISAEKGRLETWSGRLAADRPTIGIAWQGNRAYAFDHLRSVSLPAFKPVIDREDIALFSLQKGGAVGQIAENGWESRITDLTGDMDADAAFIDTAAIIENLDLIIATDTSIPHLAGAMGKPVWIILSTAPDWRWGLEGSDCPWYPSMRLFRQTKPNDWTGVMATVGMVLDSWLAGGGAPNEAADKILKS